MQRVETLKLLSVYRDKEWWIMGVGKGIETFDDLKGEKFPGVASEAEILGYNVKFLFRTE